MGSPGDRRPDDILAYKPFVDGLRAVSIVAVLAYHAHLPGVTGGFVGVDIFFVISGFLIINQIVAGLRTGRFSFAGFWARRVLRILPPYLLVIAATLAIAPFILVAPREFRELGNEAFRSALMVVNHHFLGQTGYFDTIAAETKPLLHLWSLAVEEQFYLAAPILLALTWWAAERFPAARRTLWTVAVGGLFIASLAGCILWTRRGINPAFYLTPLRAWEFIAGGAVPLLLPLLRGRPGIVADLTGLAGAALILAAIFGLGPDLPYPSWYAVIPVAGAALVILAGLARPETPVARVLALGPMVWIGLISYAWYLWHWPLLAYERIYNLGESLPAWDAAAIALSFGLAVATHYLVERPIRRWRERIRRPALGWLTVGGGAGAAVAVALVGLFYVNVVTPAVRKAAPELWTDLADVDDACALANEKKLGRACLDGIGDRPVGLLIGNSHARMIYTTLLAEAEQAGTVLVSLVTPGCLPQSAVKGLKLPGIPPKCGHRLAEGLKTVARVLPRPPDYAILSARWNVAQSYDENRDRYQEPAFAAAGLPWPPPADIRRWVAVSLGPTIRKILDLGTDRILMIGPVPEMRYFPAECLTRVARREGNRDVCAVSRRSVDERRRTTVATLRYLASIYPNVRFIDPIDIFCDKALCRPFDEEGVLYVDDDHLNPRGAAKISAAFADDFAWAIGTSRPTVAATPAALPQN